MADIKCLAPDLRHLITLQVRDELSAENLELKRKLDAFGDVEGLRKKHEAAEARARALDEEMRFIDYTKSSEFQDKYQKPYTNAWTRAEADLRELTVALEDGNSRPATVQDLLLLANTPLGEARKLASAMFGDAADDVMAHRRIVRELSPSIRPNRLPTGSSLTIRPASRIHSSTWRRAAAQAVS